MISRGFEMVVPLMSAVISMGAIACAGCLNRFPERHPERGALENSQPVSRAARTSSRPDSDAGQMAEDDVRMPPEGASELGYTPWASEHVAWHPTRALLATAWGVIRLEPAPALEQWHAVPAPPVRFAGCDWSPDGRYLVATRFRQTKDAPYPWDVIRIEAGTGVVKVLADGRFGFDNVGPTCSPSGERVAFFSCESAAQYSRARYRLALVSVEGREHHVLLEPASAQAFAWAPSGDQVLAVRDAEGPLDLVETVVIVLADGDVQALSAPRGLADGQSWYPETWLPDGRVLVRGADPGHEGPPPYGLYALDCKTGGAEVLLRMPKWTLESAAVSPDGNAVACVREKFEGPTELVVCDLDGPSVERVRTLIQSERHILEPSLEWSGDGSQIAYWRNVYDPRARAPQLWIVNSDGTEDHKVWP